MNDALFGRALGSLVILAALAGCGQVPGTATGNQASGTAQLTAQGSKSAPQPGQPLTGPVTDTLVTAAVKDQLEARFCGPSCYYVVSGIKLERYLDAGLPESPNPYSFTAHERIVGHGWEERYSLSGTFERGKVGVQTRTKLSGQIWPRIR